MIDITNIFKHGEAEKANVELAQAHKALDELTKTAKNCLNQPAFQLYRKSFEQAESTTLEAIILYVKNYIDSGTVTETKFTVNIVRIVTKYIILRSLIRSVSQDAKRPLRNDNAQG